MQVLAGPVLLDRMQDVRHPRWEGERRGFVSNDERESPRSVPDAQERRPRRGFGLLRRYEACLILQCVWLTELQVNITIPG